MQQFLYGAGRAARNALHDVDDHSASPPLRMFRHRDVAAVLAVTRQGRPAQNLRMVQVDLYFFFFFDNIDGSLLLKAVRKHSRWQWVTLYIQRWLLAAVVLPDGAVQQCDKRKPQG